MSCERTFRCSRENDLIMNGALHDELLPQCGERVEGVKIISIRRDAFTLKNSS
jgi:hypothetical protein